ncbi:GNAT family N-acetyltransferase [Mariniflexile ostreae]|uniref:GNAT family N-acetyltransferase n=1 Tax=Mariniflexile ostreae TaxID=1520892 RepID=A0ABV5FDR8_9FLAO
MIFKNYKVVKKDFYNTLSKENKVLDGYRQLVFEHNQKTIFTSNSQENATIKNTTNVALFPSYLHPNFNSNTPFNVVEMPQNKITGYAILLKEYADLETLFKSEFKKSFRANILRFVNRFESCFNAQYHMYFGDISEAHYHFLMNTLHHMLTHRFNQRNDSNKVLKHWDDYLKTSYALIKEKKASLFVIYHNTVPVHICLNHHFNNILFVSVPSYDIDYAKFALGNISLYKLLEWSVENKYDLMDMAYGDLEYKRRWSNLIYSFNHHILYPKHTTLAQIAAAIQIQKLNIKNYLKSKNIDVLVDTIKCKFKKNTPYREAFLFTFEDVKAIDTNGLNQITEESPAFVFIKKPINEFLYMHKEHIKDLNVFEIKANQDYLIIGKNKKQTLSLKLLKP